MLGRGHVMVRVDDDTVAELAGLDVEVDVIGTDVARGGRRVVGGCPRFVGAHAKAEIGADHRGVGSRGVRHDEPKGVNERVDGRHLVARANELGEDVVGVGVDEGLDSRSIAGFSIDQVLAALEGKHVEAGGKSPVAGLTGELALLAQHLQKALDARTHAAGVQGEQAVFGGVVVILGEQRLELRAGEHVAERELVVDPDALPVVERPDAIDVVIGEIRVLVLLVQPVGAGGLGIKAVGVRPLKVIGVV